MKYSEAFTDYEKMLHEGILNGFIRNDFQLLYEYLYKRKGVSFANSFMMKSKREKKRYCADLVLVYIDSEALHQKATKYITKYDKRQKKLK